MNPQNILGGDEGERESVDILAVEGGESARPHQRRASCRGVNPGRLQRPTDLDAGGVNDAESVKTKDLEMFLSPDTGPDSLVDNLRGYETVEDYEEIHKNVVAWKKQDHESVVATEEFLNNDRLVATANITVQRESSKEGQSKVKKKSDGRCEDVVSIVVSEIGVEEECTNL